MAIAELFGLLTKSVRAPARRRRGHPPWLALGFLAVVLICAALGPMAAPAEYNTIDLGATFQPPVWVSGGSAAHLFGTDNLGRDILSGMLDGARISVVVAFWAILVSGAIGTVVGLLSAYFGRWCDAVLSRLVDIQMSIPALPLALVFAAVLQPGISTVVIVIVLTYWTWYARMVRAEALSLKDRGYVALARVAGCGPLVILRRHLLPNIANTLLVLSTLQLGSVIIFESSLSFLGLGIQPPLVSWGGMLADGRNYIEAAWWVITLPGLAIMGTCLASNVVGDWLRDALDPKLRG